MKLRRTSEPHYKRAKYPDHIIPLIQTIVIINIARAIIIALLKGKKHTVHKINQN